MSKIFVSRKSSKTRLSTVGNLAKELNCPCLKQKAQGYEGSCQCKALTCSASPHILAISLTLLLAVTWNKLYISFVPELHFL